MGSRVDVGSDAGKTIGDTDGVVDLLKTGSARPDTTSLELLNGTGNELIVEFTALVGSRVDVGGNSGETVSDANGVVDPLETRTARPDSSGLKVLEVTTLVSGGVDVGSDAREAISNANSVVQVLETVATTCTAGLTLLLLLLLGSTTLFCCQSCERVQT